MNSAVIPVTAKVCCRHQPLLFFLHHNHPISRRSISSLASTTLRFLPSIKLSHNSIPQLRKTPCTRNSGPQIQTHFPDSLLKSTLVTAIAASLLLFFRFLFALKPAFASPTLPPPAAGTTQNDAFAAEESEYEKALKQQIESDPSDSGSLLELLQLHSKHMRFAEAIEVTEKLIKLHPDIVQWPILKYSFYICDGKRELGLNGLNEMIEKSPFCLEAYHGLLVAAVLSDDISNEAKEMEVENIKRKVEEAIGLCREAKKMKESREFRLLRVKIQLFEMKLEEASKDLEELAMEDPTDCRPHMGLVWAYHEMGRTEEAIKSFAKFKTLVPEDNDEEAMFFFQFSRQPKVRWI